MEFRKIGWHSDLHGKMNLNIVLTVCDLWYYEDLKEKGWPNELIIYEAAPRTARATPGLLIMAVKIVLFSFSAVLASTQTWNITTLQPMVV